MPSIDRVEDYPNAAGYWRMVEDTLTEVFRQDRPDASRLVLDYISRMADASELARLLVFHDEPFNVAANLLNREGSESDLERYVSLRDRNDWTMTEQAEINRAQPSRGRHAA